MDLLKNQAGLIAIFLTWFIFFIRTITGQYVYFLDDLKIIFYPLETVYAQFQAVGQLPVWSNLFGFGHPLIAWAQLGFFNPYHMLLRALQIPSITLLQMSIVSYFLFGTIGMYVFLRKSSLPQYAAALGSIVFTFSGFNIGHLNHVNFFTATMLLPWLLLATHWFVKKPELHKAATLSLITAIIALSAQPQITLYTLIIATLYGIVSVAKNHKSINWPKTISLVLLAGMLFLGLSSLATLPLLEFLPHTERDGGISTFVLYEFSYPPHHAITLMLPYFFGDHDNYWGAKSFQELAAYVGIIPVFLSGLALFRNPRKSYTTLSWFSLALMTIGILFALGIHSPVYRYLIENHIITSLSIPGRFVYLIDVAIALLAAEGIVLLAQTKKLSHSHIIKGLLLIALILIPFTVYIAIASSEAIRLQKIIASDPSSLLLLVTGIATLILPKPRPWLITAFSAITLITFGWNYNPLTSRATAYQASPLEQSIVTYNQNSQTPARIYSRENEYTRDYHSPRPSDPIGPNFSIFQPIFPNKSGLNCIIIPTAISDEKTGVGSIQVGIHTSITENPIRKQNFSSAELDQVPDISWCFDPIKPENDQPLYVSLTSNDETNVQVLYFDTEDNAKNIYLVRVTNPTSEQLEKSRKPLQLSLKQSFDKKSDAEILLLARHLNAKTGASSARWIGALSIRNYREFIEKFFANDGELFDGDNTHALVRERKLVDMTGITHLLNTQENPKDDQLELLSGTNLEKSFKIGEQTAVIASNPNAYPKAFLVPNAIFIPAADETRAVMGNPNWNPKTLVYITGPTPPKKNALIDRDTLPETLTQEATGTVKILDYQNAFKSFRVSSDEPTWLVVTDSTLPEWHTLIDNQPSPHYQANSMFKAAYVPAGDHTVTFIYSSPAINKAKKLTLGSLAITIILLITPAIKKRRLRHA